MNEVFKHYKGGLYRKLHDALDSSDKKTRLVVYVSLTYGTIWVRTATEFYGSLTHEGKDVLRFAPYTIAGSKG